MKIKNLITTIITVSSVALLSTSNIQAEEKDKHEDTHQDKNKETTIGNALEECGIGAVFFPSNKTAAIVSNIIWDLGTTAASSQSSSPSSCAGTEATAALFINKTYPVLEEQFVKGGGTHVTALLDILECDQSAQQGVINNVQSGLTASFSDASFATDTEFNKAKKITALIDQASASCNV